MNIILHTSAKPVPETCESPIDEWLLSEVENGISFLISVASIVDVVVSGINSFSGFSVDGVGDVAFEVESLFTVVDLEVTVVELVDDGDDSTRMIEDSSETAFL